MPKQNADKKQASQYDKIIKENLEITLPVIIRDLLGLDIMVSKELPDDVQHTKERKPDALKQVTDMKGNVYVLQVEFQVEDEREMVYRMAEYNIMLMRKYKLPIKQYVIFLKDAKPNMATSLNNENLTFNFNLVCISEINYKLFLSANNPEVKMLGILGSFGKEESYEAIISIIDSILSIKNGDFASNIYFKQLRIFAQLRKGIKLEFEKAMQSVSTFFKEEDDYFYRKGEKRGEEIGEERSKHKIVENLILEPSVSDELAARVAKVSLDYVRNVRAELEKK